MSRRHGQTADPAAQKLMGDRQALLEADRNEGLRTILSTIPGRRRWWQDNFDRVMKPIPMANNIEMTASSALHNDARKAVLEARREHPGLFWEAFKEAVQRSQEQDAFERQLNSPAEAGEQESEDG